MASREPTIAFTAPDPRTLLERLCVALGETLADHDGGGEGDELIPWQATAETLPDLARDIVQLVMDTLDDEGARLGYLEFGGLLETDHGPRSWGTVALRPEGDSDSVRIDIGSITVEEIDTGWQFEARLVEHVGGRESDRG